MSCPCDLLTFPTTLAIAPEQPAIPRQIGTFVEFRAALLHAVRSKPKLAAWKADVAGDLGLMLLEMGAYLFDAVSFYDEVVASECYIRTARLPKSLRALVGRLGYVARPATGSSVQLIAFADGRLSLALPKGTAFRSGAFSGNPPQVFELDDDTSVHPLNNQWNVARTRPATLDGPSHTLLLEARTARVRAGDNLLISSASVPGTTANVLAVTQTQGIAGDAYVRATLDTVIPFVAGAPLANVSVLKTTRRAAFWNLAVQSGDPDPVDIPLDGIKPSRLVLDRINHAIHVGGTILVGKGTEYRRFVVQDAADIQMHLPAPAPTTVVQGSVSTTVTPAPPPVPATQLSLDENLNAADRKAPGALDWVGTNRPSAPRSVSAADFTLYYGLQTAGTLTRDVDSVLPPSLDVTLVQPVETPVDQTRPPSTFVLSDLNTQAVEVTGSLDYPDATLRVDTSATWTRPLTPQVSLYGNVLGASRGASVASEVLGVGDASQPSQSFTLKKSPLTYFPTPSSSTPHGLSNTLAIFVNGVLWQEVPNFLLAGPTDQVYIVRQRDDATSVVTFGDGTNGVRVGGPIHASYRYGAGAAVPPALSVRQLAKPVVGLRSVRNPLAAFGGSDADPPQSVRTLAPRSALLFGRAVSIDDMQVVAAQTPGVVTANAHWAWSTDQQRPLVQITYVGHASLGATVKSRLRELTDPTVAFAVDAATAIPIALALDVEIDRRSRPADLQLAITTLLTDPDAGLLLPQNLGIGTTLFVSMLFAEILAVPGTVAVTGTLWNGGPFPAYGMSPGDSGYFDFTVLGSVAVTTHAGVRG